MSTRPSQRCVTQTLFSGDMAIRIARPGVLRGSVICVHRPVPIYYIQAEDDRKAREREERRRQDRLRREDFKEFLQGMVEENAITADTTWKDLKRSIEEEDAYKAMEGQPGGARDVFDDIVADLRRQVGFPCCGACFALKRWFEMWVEMLEGGERKCVAACLCG